MKFAKILIALFVLASSFFVHADLLDNDAGVYVILKPDRTPSDLLYRLSKSVTGWQAEGKQSNGEWKTISCEQGCQFSSSSETDIAVWFPPDWRANTDIACIRNEANAFCRFSAKGEPEKVGYVMIALVSETPIPVFLRRMR